MGGLTCSMEKSQSIHNGREGVVPGGPSSAPQIPAPPVIAINTILQIGLLGVALLPLP